MKDGCSKCTKTTSSIQDVNVELVDIAIMALESNVYINDLE